MSVDDYLAKRGSFSGKDPCTGESVAKGPKRNRQVTKNANKDRLKGQKGKYTKQMLDKGLGPADAKRLGSTKAKHEMFGAKLKPIKNIPSRQNALHNQDMVAGGDDVIGSLGVNGTRELGDANFGLGDTNQHIGSQWNGERINSMDKAACERKQAGEGKDKMNVELRPCGKKEAKAAGCKPPKARK